MEIKNDKVILRDFIESDIEDRIYWETVETEWQLWDAPWEFDGGRVFDSVQYRKERLEWLAKEKDENRIRWGFQICISIYSIFIKQWNRRYIHSDLVWK